MKAAVYDPDHRVHIEWQWPLSGVHTIMKSAQSVEGEGVHALPLSLHLCLPSRTKLWCMLPVAPSFYSTPVCTL